MKHSWKRKQVLHSFDNESSSLGLDLEQQHRPEASRGQLGPNGHDVVDSAAVIHNDDNVIITEPRDENTEVLENITGARVGKPRSRVGLYGI